MTKAFFELLPGRRRDRNEPALHRGDAVRHRLKTRSVYEVRFAAAAMGEPRRMAAGRHRCDLPCRVFGAGARSAAGARLAAAGHADVCPVRRFAVDYVARLALAERRLPWFFRHLLDLAI